MQSAEWGQRRVSVAREQDAATSPALHPARDDPLLSYPGEDQSQRPMSLGKNLVWTQLVNRTLCVQTILREGKTSWKQASIHSSARCPIFFFFSLSFVLLGPHQWHMEVPRLRVQSELQLPAYTTAMAIPDLSRICDLHHSSWQRWILNPLSETRNRTRNLMVPSWIRFHCATTGIFFFGGGGLDSDEVTLRCEDQI